MSITDFTKYYLTKGIRVLEDTRDRNHKYVIEDVMCFFFDNGHNYWEGLKHELMAAGLRAPTAYNTYITEQGPIDVATRWQLLQIISYIPHRQLKKEKLKVWLENHSKPKPSETNTNAKPKEQKTEKPKEKGFFKIFDKVDEENKKIIYFAIAIFIAIVCGLLTRSFVVFFSISIAGIFIAHADFMYFLYDDSYKPNSYYHPYRPNKTKKGKTDPNKIPKAIINKISFILRRRLMTYKEREKIVNEALNSGVYLSVIKSYINNELKDRIAHFKNVELIKCVNCREKIPDDVDQCPFCGKMQIWPELQQLTGLALSDRVLTDLERETIVNKAIKGGINREEINQYLNDQLSLRLESYTKVDLRDCPHCGAQIPLISDQCMYCGKPLEHIKGNTNIAFNITGKEADIIRSENLRIEQERHGIKHCPDCGAPFPLISNICESCGHVLHERNENALNIKNLIDNIQHSINRVNQAPKPKVYQILFYWFYYILLMISVAAFIVSIITDSEAGKIFSLAGFVAGIFAMGTNAVLSDTKSPVLIADGEYFKAKHSYEMYAREVETLYGDDYEAQKMLSNFSSTLKEIKRERYQNRIKVGRIILLLSFSILGIITFLSVKSGNNKVEVAQPIIHEEITMPPNSEWILNYSKQLKPYPPESGIIDSLSTYLRANKGAELSFVMSQENNKTVFSWKVSRLELLPGKYADINHIFKDCKLCIQLLDSTYTQIPMLNNYVVDPFLPQENYNTVISSGKGHFFIDFWLKTPTNDGKSLFNFAQQAVYYTIYSSKN